MEGVFEIFPTVRIIFHRGGRRQSSRGPVPPRRQPHAPPAGRVCPVGEAHCDSFGTELAGAASAQKRGCPRRGTGSGRAPDELRAFSVSAHSPQGRAPQPGNTGWVCGQGGRLAGWARPHPFGAVSPVPRPEEHSSLPSRASVPVSGTTKCVSHLAVSVLLCARSVTSHFTKQRLPVHQGRPQAPDAGHKGDVTGTGLGPSLSRPPPCALHFLCPLSPMGDPSLQDTGRW